MFQIIIRASFLIFLSSCAANQHHLAADTYSSKYLLYSDENFDTCTLKSPQETWAYWDAVLSDDDKHTIKSTPYADLILFHSGWGMGIRNGFCLWRGGPLADWFIERNVTHPDNMSGYLIELYWANLNGCKPDVEAFVEQTYPPGTDHLNCPPYIDLTPFDHLEGIENRP